MGVVRELNIATEEERNLIERQATVENNNMYRFPPVEKEKPIINPEAPVLNLQPDVYDLSDIMMPSLYGQNVDLLDNVQMGALTRHFVNYEKKTVTAYYFNHLTLQWIKTSASWADKEVPLSTIPLMREPVWIWYWGRYRAF